MGAGIRRHHGLIAVSPFRQWSAYNHFGSSLHSAVCFRALVQLSAFCFRVLVQRWLLTVRSCLWLKSTTWLISTTVAYGLMALCENVIFERQEFEPTVEESFQVTFNNWSMLASHDGLDDTGLPCSEVPCAGYTWKLQVIPACQGTMAETYIAPPHWSPLAPT